MQISKCILLSRRGPILQLTFYPGINALVGTLCDQIFYAGNLADLEEITPTIGRPHCSKLYEESVECSITHYSNHHVYPHTYQGGKNY